MRDALVPFSEALPQSHPDTLEGQRVRKHKHFCPASHTERQPPLERMEVLDWQMAEFEEPLHDATAPFPLWFEPLRSLLVGWPQFSCPTEMVY
jgi:hypothetical protein